MLQVILDTNVVVAAMRSALGASFLVLDAVGGGRFEINLSVALALEYEEVLKRGAAGSHLTPDEADDVVSFLCSNGRRRQVGARGTPTLLDPDDEFLVDLSRSFACDYIVTHNVRHLAPVATGGVRVVTPGEFLTVIGAAT